MKFKIMHYTNLNDKPINSSACLNLGNTNGIGFSLNSLLRLTDQQYSSNLLSIFVK